MRRGDIYRIQTLRGERLVLVVGNPDTATLYKRVYVAPLEDPTFVRETLLTVAVQGKICRVAELMWCPLDRFAPDREGAASADELEQVNVALKTVFDLP